MTQPAKSSITVEDVIELVRREYEVRMTDIGRKMYRRGYLAGRASQRRGAPAVTNPERHARGEARELLR